MYPTDLTVGAVIIHDGKYLMVEELSGGRAVFSQPGGHLESDESPEQAAQREVLEETGCIVSCNDLIGVYLWIHPQTRQQFLRLVYTADLVRSDDKRPLDDGILARHWMNRADIEAQRSKLRSPVVLRCIDDFEAGRRQSDALISGMLPLHNNVDRVIARADLV